MKHSFRWIMACVLLSCAVFSGCAGHENPDTPPDTSRTPDQQTFAPSQITLIENGGSAYTIVYASGSGVDYRAIATDVQRQIEKYTGIKLPMSRDGSTGAPTENCILVGPTSFAQSMAVCDGMRGHDYTVRTDGSHLVLGLIGEKAAGNALDVLIDAVADYDDTSAAPLVLSLNESVTFTGYRLRSFTVEGVSLSEFAIVYGKDENAEAALAVQEQIFDAYGYLLPVYMDWVADPTGHEILVGETKRAASKSVAAPTDALGYAWSVSDGNLVLKSAGLHSLIRGAGLTADHFAALGKDVALENGYTAAGTIHKPAWEAAWAEGTDIRVMSTNVLADTYIVDWNAYPHVEHRSEMFFAALEYYQPAIIGAQEFDKYWWREWNKYAHKDQYAIHTADNPRVSGEKYLSNIIYRTDLLEMEEGDNVYYKNHTNGRCRVMCWGVFKVKATGERFIFLNTHWDVDGVNDDGTKNPGYKPQQAAETVTMLRDLQAKYDLPVICTADWNTTETSDIMRNFLKEMDMVVTRQVLHSEQINYIDMILATKDVSVIRWDRLEYHKKPDLGTDHPWVMADLKLPD